MELHDFLIKAKKSTYASQGESGEKKLSDGSKEFVHEEGAWIYRDRFFGSTDFVGEEIVMKDKKPVWAMNYHGRITSTSVTPADVFDFLKECLLHITPERPFRGPSGYQRDGWKYLDKSNGTINNFRGFEEISFQNKTVYELTYHGGLIM